MRNLSVARGTIFTTLGLISSGLSTVVLFAIVSRYSPVEVASQFGGFWFALIAVSSGLFGAVEKETSRAFSRARVSGVEPDFITKLILRSLARLLIVACLVFLCFGGLVTGTYFYGDTIMFLSFVIGCTSHALLHFARGWCSGSGRFGYFAIILASDSSVKLSLVLSFLVLDFKVSFWCLGVAASPFIVLAVPFFLGHLPLTLTSFKIDNDAALVLRSSGHFFRNFFFLTIAAMISSFLVNGGPISINLMSLESSAQLLAAVAFSNWVLLSRIPIFLFQGVQAVLLPVAVDFVVRGEIRRVKLLLRRLNSALGALYLIGLVLIFSIGDRIQVVIFGTSVPRTIAILIFSATVLQMSALGLAQVLVAFDQYVLIVSIWLIAGMIFLLSVAVFPFEPILKVSMALLVSGIGAVFIFGIIFRNVLLDRHELP